MVFVAIQDDENGLGWRVTLLIRLRSIGKKSIDFLWRFSSRMANFSIPVRH